LKPRTALRIFVITSGWVFIGRVEVGADGSHVLNSGGEVTILGPACIRRWGTTRGLGQIAKNGPTQDTLLDPCPNLFVPRQQIILSIQCDEDSWKKKIPVAA
jgi:hypothetical protein